MEEIEDRSRAAVVVIGRNEGERLLRCLESVASVASRVVYVDSGSTDGSVSAVLARFPGVVVHGLSLDRPFSAARARNEGVDVVLRNWPELRYVQFIDGDCKMELAWLPLASALLDAQQDCAAVIGQLQEMHADATIYNRLCAMEWASAAGDIEDCGSFGGISMVRISVFRAVGGFNPAVIAGEDSEMAVRMKLAGHRITKLDAPMASHDAAMTRFSEFWRRAVRSGHAIGQRYDLHGRGPAKDCARDMRSVKIWGLGLPLLALVLGAFTQGWGLALWPLGVGWLFSRVSAYRQRRGDRPQAAALYAAAIILTKYAQVRGLLTYWARRRSNEFHIIEYK
jgi:GT2 family glycosyltransferase